MTPTHIHMHSLTKILLTYVFLLLEVWRRAQTAAGWLHWPLSLCHHESLTAGRWKEERKGNNTYVCADAVAFISVVVKTDLHVLYFVTTRQKNCFWEWSLLQNVKIKSGRGISRENISGLIRKATHLVLDPYMIQHIHYMGPFKKNKNTSFLKSHYLIPSSTQFKGPRM